MANATFETLSCRDFENGDRLLIADYSVDCEGSEYASSRLLAIASTALFVIGQPVCLVVILLLGKNQNGGVLKTAFDVLSDVRESRSCRLRFRLISSAPAAHRASTTRPS